jgi:hypothetical protein
MTPLMRFELLPAKATQVIVALVSKPAPSTLRVSHPLSGLIPPEPCGFVSRRIRP